MQGDSSQPFEDKAYVLLIVGACRVNFFALHYGITDKDLERYLSAALSAGGDYTDFYFEHLTSTSLTLEESCVVQASRGVSCGCGVRVLAGEYSGYGCTDELSTKRILQAARTAAFIANGPARVPTMGIKHDLTYDAYPVTDPSADVKVTAKLDLLARAERAALEFDTRVKLVRASFADEVRNFLVVGSDGTVAEDSQPLARLNVSVICKSNGVTARGSARGSASGGGRLGFNSFLATETPEQIAEDAARSGLVQLDTRPGPVGEMEVVLGPGWPGILFSHSVAQGLEADFVRKGTSIFARSQGQRVGAEFCSLVDDATIKWSRGSLNVDDEGHPGQRTVLVEKGILRQYLHDKLSSQLMGMAPTGNGRRESYEHAPLPRATNICLVASKDEHEPDDILRSVRDGIYVTAIGGAQVDITTGDFIATVNEAYRIEDRRITYPIRNCVLVGNGRTLLMNVTMVGNDAQSDRGVGTTTKDGQAVPVGVVVPTVKISRLTVGAPSRY